MHFCQCFFQSSKCAWKSFSRNLLGLAANFLLSTSVDSKRFPRSGNFLVEETGRSRTVPYQMNTELAESYLLNFWPKEQKHCEQVHYGGGKIHELFFYSIISPQIRSFSTNCFTQNAQINALCWQFESQSERILYARSLNEPFPMLFHHSSISMGWSRKMNSDEVSDGARDYRANSGTA